MKKSLSTRLMYSFMTIIIIVVVGITAGISYLIADYFFQMKEQELAEKGDEMGETIEAFIRLQDRDMLYRYILAVDKLVGARIWLFDDNYELLAASNYENVQETGENASMKDFLKYGAPSRQVLQESVRKLDQDMKSSNLSYRIKVILNDVYAGKSFKSQIYHPYYKEQVILVGVPYTFGKGHTGGIDITIGVAQMFGITLPENFRRPFFSKSIAEYWRRWHITLCAWFKDYLFYPLSMSKWMNKVSRWLKKHVGKPVGSRFPVYFSSLTVWFVTGIWHGASWNFVVWGLLNSIIMLVSQELKPLYEKADNRLGYRKLKYYKVFEIIRTTAIVCCLQMLDYYRNIAEAFRMFFSMFTGGNYAAVFTKGMWSIGLSAADYIVLFAGVVIMFAYSHPFVCFV